MTVTEKEIIADTDGYAEHLERELDRIVKQTKDFIRLQALDLRNDDWSKFQNVTSASGKERLEQNLKVAWRCIDYLYNKLQETQKQLEATRAEL